MRFAPPPWTKPPRRLHPVAGACILLRLSPLLPATVLLPTSMAAELLRTELGRLRRLVRNAFSLAGDSPHVFSNGILVRDVIDWGPRKRYVLDNGYSGHYEENAKPPGGSFRVTFTSPDTMVWQDVNFGGTVTYRRSE